MLHQKNQGTKKEKKLISYKLRTLSKVTVGVRASSIRQKYRERAFAQGAYNQS